MATASWRPFWGEATSYLNFCEEDYIVTRYVAEFVNTFSSLAFVFYGIFGLSQIRWNEQASARLILYSGLIGVGCCSGAYHMTLKYHTQMSDELSMHLLTTPLLYRVLTFDADERTTRITGIILSLLFTIVMVTHMVMDEFLLHAISFGLAVLLIVIRVTILIPQRVTDPSIKRNLQIVARFGCVSFVFGYLVWLVDEWVCSALISVRHTVGMPLAFLFELHGWWHVCTAIGGYVAVAIVDEITSGPVKEDPTNRFAWPIPLAARHMGFLVPAAKKD